jgi:ferredoxin
MLASYGYGCRVKPDLCVGCRLCADNCQFEALRLIGGVAVADVDTYMECSV